MNDAAIPRFSSLTLLPLCSADIICALLPYAGSSTRASDTRLTRSWAPEAPGTALQPSTRNSTSGFDVFHPVSRGWRPRTRPLGHSPATSGTGSGEGRCCAQGQQLISVNHLQPRAARCTARPRRGGSAPRPGAVPQPQQERPRALGLFSQEEAEGRTHCNFFPRGRH